MSNQRNEKIAMSRLSVLFSVFLLFNQSEKSFAQHSKKTEPEIQWISGITIDGDLSDWKDSLQYVYASQKLQYTIGNDDKNLYIAMRVSDMDKQMQALTQGFGFTINPEGKKKAGPTIIFPVPDRESLRAIMSSDNENKPTDMRIGAIQAIRAIYVAHFDDIVDGPISLQNNYGINAAVKIDTADAICYEAVIPLSRLNINPEDEQSYAFNIKINGLIMPSRYSNNSYPMNGMRGYPYGYGYPSGYGSGISSQGQPRQETGVWIIAKLKKQL